MSTTGVGSTTADMMAIMQATLMRKSLDTEKQTAQRLLQVLPQQNQNPPHVGRNLDVRV